jgi:hypothetical protein
VDFINEFKFFTPTCFGKWLPSSGNRRCLISYSSNVCFVGVYGLRSVQCCQLSWNSCWSFYSGVLYYAQMKGASGGTQVAQKSLDVWGSVSNVEGQVTFGFICTGEKYKFCVVWEFWGFLWLLCVWPCASLFVVVFSRFGVQPNTLRCSGLETVRGFVVRDSAVGR